MHQVIADRYDPVTREATAATGWQVRCVKIRTEAYWPIASVTMTQSDGRFTVCMIGAGGSGAPSDCNRIRVFEDGVIKELLSYQGGKLTHVKYITNPSLCQRALGKLGGWRIVAPKRTVPQAAQNAQEGEVFRPWS